LRFGHRGSFPTTVLAERQQRIATPRDTTSGLLKRDDGGDSCLVVAAKNAAVWGSGNVNEAMSAS